MAHTISPSLGGKGRRISDFKASLVLVPHSQGYKSGEGREGEQEWGEGGKGEEGEGEEGEEGEGEREEKIRGFS